MIYYGASHASSDLLRRNHLRKSNQKARIIKGKLQNPEIKGGEEKYPNYNNWIENWRQRENSLPPLISCLLSPPQPSPPLPSQGFSSGCRCRAAEVRMQINSGSGEITGRHRAQIMFCWRMSPGFPAAPLSTESMQHAPRTGSTV